jgi:two-component system, NarL family, response regulator YdfI
VIRVLLASQSAELESAIRSSASLEFAGRVDRPLAGTDLAADVLLLEVEAGQEYDWRALADLPIPVVLLLDPSNSAVFNSVLRAGIRGVLSGDATPQEIESALQAVYVGLVVTAPEFLAGLHPAADELAEPLSERELEVLDLLAEGLSNKLIAHRLSISEHTVKTHVAAIFAKLGASSRTEAVSQAIRRGLVML